jgi:hypothetical protein
MNKKMMTSSFTLVALLSLMITGCNNTKTSVASASVADSVASTSVAESTGVALPDASIRVRGVETLEVGYAATIKAIVSTDADDDTVSFTVDDPTILSLADATTGVKSIEVTALKAGKATLTATATCNSTVSKTFAIEVTAAKPTLKDAWKAIIAKPNYTFVAGTYDAEAEDVEGSKTAKYYTRVTENAITMTDAEGNNFYINSDSKNALYGEAVSNAADGKVVFLGAAKSGTAYGDIITTNAELVKSDIGFLTKSNFGGAGEEATSPNDVAGFFGLAALNPKWFTAEKNQENVYEIVGQKDEEDAEGKTSSNVGLYGSYVESMLWEIVDPEGYMAYASGKSELQFTSIASEITTTIKVLGQDDVFVSIKDSAGAYHYGEITAVGTTTMDDIAKVKAALTTGLSPASPTLSTDLTAAKTALAGNDYIQTAYELPDRDEKEADQFKAPYQTYYTDAYYFRYYDPTFIAAFNALTTQVWDKASYGYAKKADGIYKFTYAEPATGSAAGTLGTITWADTKEEGTDKDTVFTTWAKYISTTDIVTGDLLYTYTDTQSAIWNGVSTVYHRTSSRTAMLAIANYYGEVPSSEAFDKSLSGIGTAYDSNNALMVNFTYGYHIPTDADNWYQAFHFSLHDFGSAATSDANPVKTLI